MELGDYHVNVVWKAIPRSNAYYALNPAQMAIVDSKAAAMINALIPADRQVLWKSLSFQQVNGDAIYAQLGVRLMNELIPPAGTLLALPPNMPAYVQWRWTPPTHTIMFSVQLSNPDGSNPRPWDFAISHRGSTYGMRMGLSYDCTLDQP